MQVFRSWVLLVAVALAGLVGCADEGGNPDSRPDGGTMVDGGETTDGGGNEGGGGACENGDCGSNGQCVDESGEARCDCDDGYRAVGLTCVQISAEACAPVTADELPTAALSHPDARAGWPLELLEFQARLETEMASAVDAALVTDSSTVFRSARSAARNTLIDFDDNGAAVQAGNTRLVNKTRQAFNRVQQVATELFRQFETTADTLLSQHDDTCRDLLDLTLDTLDVLTGQITDLEGLAGADRTAVQTDLADLRTAIVDAVTPLCSASDADSFEAYFDDYQQRKAALLRELDFTVEDSIARRTEVAFEATVQQVRARRTEVVSCASTLMVGVPEISDLDTTNNNVLRATLLEAYWLGVTDLLNAWYWDNLCEATIGQDRMPVTSAEPCGANGTPVPAAAAAPLLADLAALTALTPNERTDLRNTFERDWTSYPSGAAVTDPFNEGFADLIDDRFDPSPTVRSLNDMLFDVVSSLSVAGSPNTNSRNTRLFDSLDYIKDNDLITSPSANSRNTRLFDSLDYIKDNTVITLPSANWRNTRLFDALDYVKDNTVITSPSANWRNTRLFDALDYVKDNTFITSPSANSRNTRLFDCVGVALRDAVPDVAACLPLTDAVDTTLASVLASYSATRASVQQRTKALVGLAGLDDRWDTIADGMHTDIRGFYNLRVADFADTAPRNLQREGLAVSLPLTRGSTVETRSYWIRRWFGTSRNWFRRYMLLRGL